MGTGAKGVIETAFLLGLEMLFPENQPTLVFTPTLKILWTLYWGGPKFFGLNCQLLARHASCPDHLSTKIIKHVKVK